LTDCPEGYARLCARGVDSYQEAWNWTISTQLERALEAGQGDAQDAGEPVLITIMGVAGHVAPGGAKGGKRWTFKTADFLFLFGSPKADWQISVRYLSAGLWQKGVPTLRYQAAILLARFACRPRGDDASRWCRVSRLDYAFDFHAPCFTMEIGPEMTRAIVAHSSCKVRLNGHQDVEPEVPWEMIGTSARTETLTIGSKRSLQLQIYDKTTEIREASGKEWMREMWAGHLDGEVPERDVWRLEIRIAKEFLKNRNLRTRDDIDAALPRLLLEGVLARRVTVPDASDSNRRRWPVHPIWSECARLSGGDCFMPIGRVVTMRRSEYIEQMERQAGGIARVIAVARDGDLDHAKVPEILETVRGKLQGDGSNRRKVRVLKSRLSGLYDEAQ
jgi:hypothetical protein